MKSKIVLTILIITLFFSSMGLWSIFKSPVAGITSAAQLDDTLRSYMAARIISENFVENTLGIVCAILLLIIWAIPAKKKNI